VVFAARVLPVDRDRVSRPACGRTYADMRATVSHEFVLTQDFGDQVPQPGSVIILATLGLHQVDIFKRAPGAPGFAYRPPLLRHRLVHLSAELRPHLFDWRDGCLSIVGQLRGGTSLIVDSLILVP
jgi:hypothetical protein